MSKYTQNQRDAACTAMKAHRVHLDKPEVIGDAAFDYLLELACSRNELLEALKDSLRWLDSLEIALGKGEKFVDAMPNNCTSRCQMRAAIANAEAL